MTPKPDSEPEPQRYQMWISKEHMIKMLKKDDKNNDMIIDIERIEIENDPMHAINGKILIEGKQKKIIDGVIQKE